MTRHCQLIQVGQTVRVESNDAGYRLTILTPADPGPKVVEKGEDYVVLEDAQCDVLIRIPLHLICSVTPAVAEATVSAA